MKTVKVKIAVAVDTDGEWNSSGWSPINESDDLFIFLACKSMSEKAQVYWLTAELPVPENPTITTICANMEKAK